MSFCSSVHRSHYLLCCLCIYHSIDYSCHYRCHCLCHRHNHCHCPCTAALPFIDSILADLNFIVFVTGPSGHVDLTGDAADMSFALKEWVLLAYACLSFQLSVPVSVYSSIWLSICLSLHQSILIHYPSPKPHTAYSYTFTFISTSTAIGCVLLRHYLSFQPCMNWLNILPYSLWSASQPSWLSALSSLSTSSRALCIPFPFFFFCHMLSQYIQAVSYLSLHISHIFFSSIVTWHNIT